MIKFPKFYWNISPLQGKAQQQEIRCHFKKGNMGQGNSTKRFKFNSFSQIFYYGMTRHRNKKSSKFIRKNSFKKGKYEETNFKKLFKFHNSSELFCHGTWPNIRNLNLGISWQQKDKNYFMNRKCGTIIIRNSQKLEITMEMFYHWTGKPGNKRQCSFKNIYLQESCEKNELIRQYDFKKYF